jgi:hypothetical protein
MGNIVDPITENKSVLATAVSTAAIFGFILHDYL